MQTIGLIPQLEGHLSKELDSVAKERQPGTNWVKTAAFPFLINILLTNRAFPSQVVRLLEGFLKSSSAEPEANIDDPPSTVVQTAAQLVQAVKPAQRLIPEAVTSHLLACKDVKNLQGKMDK